MISSALYDKFWKRKYELVITKKGQTIFKCSELDIKFEIERLFTTHICESKISILGISRETMNPIIKVAREVFMKAAEMEIEVDLCAGYGDGPVSSIFRGFVIDAKADTPPDMWLHLTCVNYCDVGTKAFSVSVCPPRSYRITYLDVAKTVAKECGFSGVDSSLYTQPAKSAGEQLKSSFVVSGTRQRIINALSSLHSDKWKIAVDMNVLKIMDRTPKYSKKPFVFNAESGLLAVTNVDFIGCYVTTFLQDLPANQRWVRVESKNNPGANDVFAILSKKFVGHYRGDKWNTVFELYLRGQMT